MALARRHNFKFTPESMDKIDYLLPKLKHSVVMSKVVRWLENFEEKDLPLVYDFLQVFEFIPFTEMQYRVEDELKKIFELLKDGEKALIVPYGKFGKSATLVSYPLTHSETYEKLKKKKRIIISNDLDACDDKDIKCVIFLDDFIGSGETFCDEYKYDGLKEWCDKKGIAHRYVLCCVIMKEGLQKIEKEHSEIKVFGQVRGKVYSESESPLKILGAIKEYKNIGEKYERLSKVEKDFLNGYSNSQAIIAFTHCTPDNTLPFFWWHKNWIPLFPRKAKVRMDDAREFKKDIAFYIGICNRMNIDLFSLEEYTKEENLDAIENQRKYNNKDSHSIIALLKLKEEGVEDYVICHVLSLTDDELEGIYAESELKGFTNSSKEVTPEGAAYIKRLDKKISKEKSRSTTEENLKPKELIYVPKTFKGLT